jgi:ATP/maltotriose-dependent transcriptional regulator MalT
MRAQHDVDGQRRALLNLVKMYSDDGDADTALALLQEGWSLASTFESPVAECAFLNGFYYCNYLRGDLGAAWTAAERVLDSARPLSSLYWRVGSIVVVTDLYCHLGEWSRAGELVDAALAQLADSGEQVMRARALVRRAWLDQLTGEPARALERIDALLAEGPVEHAEDAAGLARVRAQALLDLGQPEAALAVLADYDGAPTREVWAQMLAQRLQIGVALGHAVAADVERARQEVGDRRLPALEGLILSRRLVATLNALGERDEAVALGRSHDATRTRLAVSLEAWPAVRDSFLRRFPAST